MVCESAIGRVSAHLRRARRKCRQSVERRQQVPMRHACRIADCGGQAFIVFKSTASGRIGGAFEKAFHYFKLEQEKYMQHYHRRSNVESTFSAVKRKFGDAVMGKTDTAMTNEVLCKFLCRNLTCLIQEQETLGIAPIFWKHESPEAIDADILPMQRLSAQWSS
jgi:hypothetical protein